MGKAKAKTLKSNTVGDNLVWAVGGLLFVAILSSGISAYACDWVLSSFQNSNTMAMLITDAGLKSDDKNLQNNLSSATKTLALLRDVELAVMIGSLGVTLALAYRKLFPLSGKPSKRS